MEIDEILEVIGLAIFGLGLLYLGVGYTLAVGAGIFLPGFTM